MARAIVLPGGGSRGAWQVGGLRYLRDEGLEEPIVYTGISVGAVNALGLAQNKKFSDGVDELHARWMELTDNRVKRHWLPLSYVHGLWETGLHNTSPLLDTLKTYFRPTDLANSGKLLRVGATELQTGRYQIFTEKSPDILLGVHASAAFPVMFQTVEIGDLSYIDGGIKSVAPLREAIKIPEVDQIDIILPQKARMPRGAKPKNIFDVAVRAIEILATDVLLNDLARAEDINKHIYSYPGKRYIKFRLFQPLTPQPGGELDFDSKNIRIMDIKGYEEVRKQAENMPS